MLKRLLLAALLGSLPLTAACAQSPGICPAKPGDMVRSLDVFDGKPEDGAYLVPDQGPKGVDTFLLGNAYNEGRTATIRCKYASGAATDVELKNKVERCEASRKKSGEVTIRCR